MPETDNFPSEKYDNSNASYACAKQSRTRFPALYDRIHRSHVLGEGRFLTIKAWTRNGLRRFLVSFLIVSSTRRVEIAGVGREGQWVLDEPVCTQPQ